MTDCHCSAIGALKKFLGGLTVKLLFSYIKSLNINDEPFYFDNNDEYTEILNQHFLPGKVFPDCAETIENPQSDESISNMAFYGLGQVLLQKSQVIYINICLRKSVCLLVSSFLPNS